MEIIVLRRETRISIFQMGELGDLFEFTFVPVINQENIVTVIGWKHRIAWLERIRMDGWKNK